MSRRICQPKKPRQQQLTRAEKCHNRQLARIRVKVEHALAGVKRSRIVKDVMHDTEDAFSDLAMAVACGLYNFRVRCRKRQLRL